MLKQPDLLLFITSGLLPLNAKLLNSFGKKGFRVFMKGDILVVCHDIP